MTTTPHEPAPHEAADGTQQPMVQLVVLPGPGPGLFASFVDRPDRAEELARTLKGTVVELPITLDFRDHDGA